MSEPIAHRFYHEVLSPLVRLQRRCAENICVQAQYNDVIVLAQEAATAAYHFPEAVFGKQREMRAPYMEELRQKLSDVVDSRKHGRLRNQERQINLQAALAYEFNDAQEFRYLQTNIIATNARFGEFNLGHTVEQFVAELNSELDIALRLTKVEPPTSLFSKTAVAYVTDKTFFAKDMQIQFFKRTANGALVPDDPAQVNFEVR